MSILDIDNDGRFEAFVCGYGGPNSLYRFANGRLEDIAAELSIDAPGRQAIGVASCDVDGDGNEEIYVLNTDSYSGDKVFSDHLFQKESRSGRYDDVMARDVNRGSRSSFAGRSVACVDRTGGGRYNVAAASYGRPLLLYEMSDARTGSVRDIARDVGFVGVTGGRGLTAGPLYPGKKYVSAPGMDIYMANERGPSFLFRNDGQGSFSEVAASLGLTDAQSNGRGVALLDANADGRIDIVTGNWQGQHRLWLQSPPTSSDGAGARFVDAAPPAMAEPSPIRTVIAADFDNDGFEEIFFVGPLFRCRTNCPRRALSLPLFFPWVALSRYPDAAVQPLARTRTTFAPAATTCQQCAPSRTACSRPAMGNRGNLCRSARLRSSLAAVQGRRRTMPMAMVCSSC